MAVRAMPIKRGAQMAVIICDDCSREEVVSCSYEGSPASGYVPSPKHANRSAIGLGWHVSGGKMLCQACNAKRRAAAAKEKKTMGEVMTEKEPAAAAIRRPTPKQERLIILALEDAYDDQAKRYKGGATDKTIADELADGIMFGWVSEIRERLFGPSGANEDMEAVRAEIAELSADVAKRMAAINKRLDGIAAAVGPKARAV